MQCSCINGSIFSCAQPFDDGQHGHRPGGAGFIPHDGSCDDDVFFGGIWHQRLKQVALANGIAVLEVNNYVRDGWESWEQIWYKGYDPPFFSALATLLDDSRAAGASSNPSGDIGVNEPAPALFRDLNHDLLAFRGWSGGANAVSWLIDRAARGQLPGLGVAAGVISHLRGRDRKSRLGAERCADARQLARSLSHACDVHAPCSGARHAVCMSQRPPRYVGAQLLATAVLRAGSVCVQAACVRVQAAYMYKEA